MSAADAAPDPLAENLRALEKRVSTPRQPPPAQAPRANEKAGRSAPRPAVRPRRARPPSSVSQRASGQARTGELEVIAEGSPVIHVYVKQCLVSGEGSGRAVLRNLAPGRYPVMLWAPEESKRRNYWVTVRAGSVASLRTRL